MESAIPSMECKVDELLAVLDKDIRHVRASLSRLDELRALVVKRDPAAMGELLEEIREQTQEYSENESARESMRRELAGILGCEVGDMTLSRLESVLDDDKRLEVGRRKTLLKSLTDKLKTEHMRTAMLLSDCARFNSTLLSGILELGNAGAITYGSDGTAISQGGSVFVSMEF
jgi:hypothetical protein